MSWNGKIDVLANGVTKRGGGNFFTSFINDRPATSIMHEAAAALTDETTVFSEENNDTISFEDDDSGGASSTMERFYGSGNAATVINYDSLAGQLDDGLSPDAEELGFGDAQDIYGDQVLSEDFENQENVKTVIEDTDDVWAATDNMDQTFAGNFATPGSNDQLTQGFDAPDFGRAFSAPQQTNSASFQEASRFALNNPYSSDSLALYSRDGSLNPSQLPYQDIIYGDAKINGAESGQGASGQGLYERGAVLQAETETSGRNQTESNNGLVSRKQNDQALASHDRLENNHDLVRRIQNEINSAFIARSQNEKFSTEHGLIHNNHDDTAVLNGISVFMSRNLGAGNNSDLSSLSSKAAIPGLTTDGVAKSASTSFGDGGNGGGNQQNPQDQQRRQPFVLQKV